MNCPTAGLRWGGRPSRCRVPQPPRQRSRLRWLRQARSWPFNLLSMMQGILQKFFPRRTPRAGQPSCGSRFSVGDRSQALALVLLATDVPVQAGGQTLCSHEMAACAVPGGWLPYPRHQWPGAGDHAVGLPVPARQTTPGGDAPPSTRSGAGSAKAVKQGHTSKYDGRENAILPGAGGL